MVRNFKVDDIFAAWSKLREACQLAASQPLQPPPKHRAEVKLAEELVKEVSETEKNGTVTLLVPSSELGLVRGRVDCNVDGERPVATRLESLEDMVKGVVEKLARMENNQTKDREMRALQPVAQPLGAAPLPGQQGHQQAQGVPQDAQQQNYAAAAGAGL